MKLIIEQGSPDWLDLRKNRIGSSDIATVAGISSFGKTIHGLWLQKTGRFDDDIKNWAMIRGQELEEEARNAYILESGNVMERNVCFIHDSKPYVASLDGYDEKHGLIVEIKCPLNLPNNKDVPPNYYAQIQWQLMLSEAKKAIYWVYHPEQGHFAVDITPDPKFQAMLAEAADAFWELVSNDIEPPHPKDDFLEIEDPEAVGDAEKYAFNAEKIKELTEEQKELKAKILDYGDGGNFKCGRVEAIWIQGRNITNWKAVCEKYNISEEMMKEFSKKGEDFYQLRVS